MEPLYIQFHENVNVLSKEKSIKLYAEAATGKIHKSNFNINPLISLDLKCFDVHKKQTAFIDLQWTKLWCAELFGTVKGLVMHSTS